MGGTKIKKHQDIEEPRTDLFADEPVAVATENGEPTPVPTKKAKKVKIKKIGKKYAESKKLVDPSKQYTLSEALELAKKASFTKFDPSVELHINLGTDPKNSSHNIRMTVSLPNSTGKSFEVIAFGDENDKKAIEDAGATLGNETTLSELESGKLTLDPSKARIVATASWMPKLAKAAKVLGPKGLMPNPKSGTVTENMASTLENFKGGMVEIKSQAGQSVIHTSVGKLSQDAGKLEENISALVKELQAAKPGSLKKEFVKALFITTTMGPAIKIDLASV